MHAVQRSLADGSVGLNFLGIGEFRAVVVRRRTPYLGDESIE